MKYAIIKCINGNYVIHAEGITTVEAAKTQFHGLCQTLWNAQDVITAMVMIADEQLDAVEGYKELILHPIAEPEPPIVPNPIEEPETLDEPEQTDDTENTEPDGDEESEESEDGE